MAESEVEEVRGTLRKDLHAILKRLDFVLKAMGDTNRF